MYKTINLTCEEISVTLEAITYQIEKFNNTNELDESCKIKLSILNNTKDKLEIIKADDNLIKLSNELCKVIAKIAIETIDDDSNFDDIYAEYKHQVFDGDYQSFKLYIECHHPNLNVEFNKIIFEIKKNKFYENLFYHGKNL